MARSVYFYRRSPWISAEGVGTQEEFMIRDTCITVDEADNVIGYGSKRECHVFSEKQNGILHRAFSVFLFNEENKLLLQKRSPTKITFPEMWTNTCCSHPLHGMDPSELDTPEDVQKGLIPGVKIAAVRKLEHELGIPSAQLPISDFKYLTRLHYCAAHSKVTEEGHRWGEHEMDYILFIRKNVTLDVNPDEVCDYKYVTLPELTAMMDINSGLSWSPWFRIIAKNFLEKWWMDLDTLLDTDVYVDVNRIHKL